MAVDTVGLELNGDVLLDDFAEAVQSLRAMLREIARNVGANVAIDWTIDDLSAGSAFTVLRGRPSGSDTEVSQVEEVVRAYGNVALALERGDRAAIAPGVEVEASRLLRLVGERVTTIRFETPEIDATVSRLEEAPLGLLLPAPRRHVAFGAVEGRIQTLTNRGRLRFTLYDTLADKPVSCYLADDFDREHLRDVWGRRARVEGVVTRDVTTYRPLSVRQVTAVNVQDEGVRSDYRQARGALRDVQNVGEFVPETVIRRLRDA